MKKNILRMYKILKVYIVSNEHVTYPAVVDAISNGKVLH